MLREKEGGRERQTDRQIGAERALWVAHGEECPGKESMSGREEKERRDVGARRRMGE